MLRRQYYFAHYYIGLLFFIPAKAISIPVLSTSLRITNPGNLGNCPNIVPCYNPISSVLSVLSGSQWSIPFNPMRRINLARFVYWCLQDQNTFYISHFSLTLSVPARGLAGLPCTKICSLSHYAKHCMLMLLGCS